MWSTIYSLIASDRKRGGGYESQWTRPTQGLVENSSFSLYCLIGCSSSISDRNNNYKARSLTSNYTHKQGYDTHLKSGISNALVLFTVSYSLSLTHTDPDTNIQMLLVVTTVMSLWWGPMGVGPRAKTECDCGHLWGGSSKTLKA